MYVTNESLNKIKKSLLMVQTVSKSLKVNIDVLKVIHRDEDVKNRIFDICNDIDEMTEDLKELKSAVTNCTFAKYQR